MPNNIKDITKPESPLDSRPTGFLSLKNQRLISVLYLLTESISDKDPLKWRLRKLALDIYSIISNLDLYDLKEANLSDQINLPVIIKKINSLAILIEVLIVTGAVSQMNFSILKKEYLAVKGLLEKISLEKNSWSQYLLETETKEMSNRLLTINQKASDKIVEKSYQLPISIGQLPTVSSQNKRPVIGGSHIKTNKSSKHNQTDRQAKILSYLRGKDWTSIKDILMTVSGCSSKTIQRELNDLVAQNVLKKKGDRRWSRYSLI